MRTNDWRATLRSGEHGGEALAPVVGAALAELDVGTAQGWAVGMPAVTFNAPGASALKRGENANITNYIRTHDVVGMFGTHLGHVIKYADVHPDFDPRNRYIIRNHSIAQFATDLARGLPASR